MDFNHLLKIENRIRLLLDDLTLYQWQIIHHQTSFSFFFRRSNQEKIYLDHETYPDFFKNLLSIKNEMTGDAQRFHLNSQSTNTIKTTLFGVTPSNAEFTALPIYLSQENSTNSSTPAAATILALLKKNTSQIKVKASEKKQLSRAGLLYSEIISLAKVVKHQETLFNFFKDFHSQSTSANLNIDQWMEIVQKRMHFESCLLYGISSNKEEQNIELIFSSKEISSDKIAEKKILLDKIFPLLSPKQSIFISVGKEITQDLYHSNKNFTQDPSLYLFLENPDSSHHFSKIILQFSRNFKENQFDENDETYIKEALELLKKNILNTKFFQKLTHLENNTSALLTNKFYTNKVEAFSRKKVEIFFKHDLISNRNYIINSSLNKNSSRDKLDRFIYWGLLDNLNKENFFLSQKTSEFFFNQNSHSDDFESNITNFFDKTGEAKNIKNFAFLEIDEVHSQTIATIKVKTKDFHFLIYDFELGKIKEIDCQTKQVFKISNGDLLIAFPLEYLKVISKSLLNQIEDIIILEGYLSHSKLIESFDILFKGLIKEYFLIRMKNPSMV